MAIVTDLSAVHRDVTDMMLRIYGDRLVKIVLFGSYARGDFHDDSDVDYLIVLADEVVSTFTEVKHVSPLKASYYLTTGITISPVVVAASQLAESMKPFFKEVRKDKKLIYERRPAYLSTES